MIKIQNVSKTFTQSKQEIKALQNINLDIDKGDIFGIIGMSGAGKSTLLRCLSALEKPDVGSITINEICTQNIKSKDLTTLRRDMGVVFQGYNLLMQKTVFENVNFPFELTHQKNDEKVLELLDIVGIKDKKDAYPSQLSGGQKQRVAIARALTTNPKVLLCDEPTSALDPKTTKQMLELLNKINKEFGVTIVIITHEINLVKAICNKVAVIDDGKICENGLVSEVFKNPQSDITKTLLDWQV